MEGEALVRKPWREQKRKKKHLARSCVQVTYCVSPLRINENVLVCDSADEPLCMVKR